MTVETSIFILDRIVDFNLSKTTNVPLDNICAHAQKESTYIGSVLVTETNENEEDKVEILCWNCALDKIKNTNHD